MVHYGEMTIDTLRTTAISNTLFPKTTLVDAMNRMGFVQADPIKAPAPAQDLILRQRVRDYRRGDLQRSYRDLQLEEEYLYAYGFFTRSQAALLHPKRSERLTALEKQVLQHVRLAGEIHPRELGVHFGKKRVVNAWGGYSHATKEALDRLHLKGYLRVAGRTRGIRMYETVTWPTHSLPASRRLIELILRIVTILQPVREQMLNWTVTYLINHSFIGTTTTKEIVSRLKREGQVRVDEIDGVKYLSQAGKIEQGPEESCVRFLAPFDPLVWDRARFEQIWGWPYRFEAYVPATKRIRGYYTLPLLWRGHIPGWVSIQKQEETLQFQAGYVDGKPRDAAFNKAFNDECERVREFMREPNGNE